MAGLKYRWRAMRPSVLSGLLFVTLRLLVSSLRMRIENAPEDFSKKIFCGWHGRSFIFANELRNRKFWVIISHSNDGEMQSRIFSRLGYRIIRGSTGRGGARALVESIRALRAGGTMAMTPDGPRGPSGVVQDGVMVMAQRGGASLVAAATCCRPRIVFSSWDRYIVPLPFGRGIVIFGDPIEVPADADAETVERLRKQLEADMHRLEVIAEERMGYRGDSIVQSLPRE